jgi:hypothetical protein
MDGGGLSAYERQRANNIAANQQVLQQLGLLDAAASMKAPPPEKKKKREKEDEVLVRTREPSKRVAGMEPRNYTDVDLDDLDRELESRRNKSSSREVKRMQPFDPSPPEPRPRAKKAKAPRQDPLPLSSVDRNKILSLLPPQATEAPSNKTLLTLREWGATSQHLVDADFPDDSLTAFSQIEQDMPFDDTCSQCYKDPSSCNCGDHYKAVFQPLKFALMSFGLMQAQRLNLSNDGAKPKVLCPGCGKHFALVMKAKKSGGALHDHMYGRFTCKQINAATDSDVSSP